MSDEEVQKWIKQSNKKKTKLIWCCSEGDANTTYRIVYFHRGKARVGTVYDGMRTRYGITCAGAMETPNPLSLWQSGPGACDEMDVDVMMSYLNGTCTLPDFDFGSLKNLRA